MWFKFGFYTLILYVFYFLRERHSPPSRGELKMADDAPYWYFENRTKNDITGFKLTVVAPEGYDFSLRSETWFDRLGKKFGVCSEHQVGHDAFDKKIYIVSDDNQLCVQLARDTRLVTLILKLFMTGINVKGKIKEIRCKSGLLSVSYGAKDDYTGPSPALEREIVPHLARMADEIKQVPRGSRWRDPFAVKASIILAISSVMVIGGLILSLIPYRKYIPFTVDTDLLWRDSILLGLSIVLALVAVTIILLRRGARTHLVLIEILFFGTFGAISTAYSTLSHINMGLDTGAESEFVVKLEEKYREGGRKYREYAFLMRDWNKEVAFRDVTVSLDYYSGASVGDKIVIRQKPGYLGYRWVEAMSSIRDPEINPTLEELEQKLKNLIIVKDKSGK
jgi:hypothetical protein